MKKYLIAIVALIFIVELFAKYHLGLGNTPTYVESSLYEYIYSPNQKVTRFNNAISTNELGLRSKPIEQNKESILIFGDSVINGGSLTNHSDLATSKIQTEFQDYNVLNISAGSWGIDNSFAFLKHHEKELGEIKTIIIYLSSHDYNDIMSFDHIVGNHPSFPNRQPMSAITDGFFRYLMPKISSLFKDKKEFLGINKGSEFNSGWGAFKSYAERKDIPIMVFLHPDKKEVINKKRNEQGELLIERLNYLEIPHIEMLNSSLRIENYRDGIHLNKSGQIVIYKEMLNSYLKR